MLLYLHGISSAGKTSIGKELLKHLPNAILIDQDTYYKKLKPLVTFKGAKGPALTGDQVYTSANWDTHEAIDFIQFNDDIQEAVNLYDYVIVTGFALRQPYMLFKPDLSILLDIGDNALHKIVTARRVSKGYSGDKAIKDYYMVSQVVYPYYLETLKEIYVDYVLPVYNQDQRILLKDLVSQILQYMDNHY